MKKEYINPEIEITDIESAGMLCNSPTGTSVFNDDYANPEGPSYSKKRKVDLWDIEEDY